MGVLGKVARNDINVTSESDIFGSFLRFRLLLWALSEPENTEKHEKSVGKVTILAGKDC